MDVSRIIAELCSERESIQEEILSLEYSIGSVPDQRKQTNDRCADSERERRLTVVRNRDGAEGRQ